MGGAWIFLEMQGGEEIIDLHCINPWTRKTDLSFTITAQIEKELYICFTWPVVPCTLININYNIVIGRAEDIYIS